MMRAVGTWTQYQNARVTRTQVNDLLTMPLESKPDAPAIHAIEGNVVLENLTFSYTIFPQLAAISVGAYGATLVIDGALTVGGLAACTLLASRSAQPMMRAVGTWTQYQTERG